MSRAASRREPRPDDTLPPGVGEGYRLQPGEPMVVESRPSPYQVVFEDDGDAAYLYVLDHRRGPEQPIVDALHVYNAADEKDGDPLDLQVVWTADGLAAALLLDGVPCAMADFAAPRFMCRSEFPPPGPDSPVTTHAWDQAAFDARFGT
jgi:hypothetical protein